MKRRSCLTAMLTVLAGTKAVFAQTAAKNPIVLYCDLSVDAAHEKQMLDNFHNIFKPAAEKFQGYRDVKILKLRTVYSGSAPPHVNYRFQLTYESEEKRQLWIHSKVHQTVWPMVESTVTDKGYLTLLTDSR